VADLVVFDLNGLLVDDERIQLHATNEALAQFGFRISEETWIKNASATSRVNTYR
jgi:beta-phosphoglucomutase-like phosphatase (HAD superfamily)